MCFAAIGFVIAASAAAAPCDLQLLGLSATPVENATVPERDRVFYRGEPILLSIWLAPVRPQARLPDTIDLEIDAGVRKKIVSFSANFGPLKRDDRDGFLHSTARIDIADSLEFGENLLRVATPMVCPTTERYSIKYRAVLTRDDRGFLLLNLADRALLAGDIARAKVNLGLARQLLGDHDEVLRVDSTIAYFERRLDDACPLIEKLFARTGASMWRDSRDACRRELERASRPTSPHGGEDPRGRPPALPSACFALVSVAGTITTASAQNVPYRHSNEVSQCYFSGSENRALPAPRVEVTVDVKSGKVARVAVRWLEPSERKRQAESQCVTDRANGWRFPENESGMLVMSWRFGDACR